MIFDFAKIAPSFDRRSKLRPLPCVPTSTWKPKPFPNLSAAKIVAIDLETYDPHLLDYGPGWARHDGHICGIAVGTEDGFRSYYPMRHEVEGAANLDPQHVLAWARDALGGPQTKIGANILYDVGWLREEGVRVGGTWLDVQFAEALLTEAGRTSLDALGEKYCGEGKYSGALYEWCARAYGGDVDGWQRANIYRAPPSLVGPYAEGDVDLPLRVFEKQLPMLRAQNLDGLFAMECGLLPLLLEMRMQGVSVDIERAHGLRDTLIEQAKSAQHDLDLLAGCEVDVNRPETIARAFDNHKLAYPRTPKSDAPSFQKAFLKGLKHPLASAIVDLRNLEKMRSTFIENAILNAHVNGKIYGQFHPLRNTRNEDEDDSEGTRSGRFSGATPNLQQIPKRDKKIAPLIRGLFVPDAGHEAWRKYDYSQIEYRFFAHYARGPKSDEIRRAYCENPRTDYHEWTLDLVAPVAGWAATTPEERALVRPQIKNVNFGLLYGMGVTKFARLYDLSQEQADALYKAYHGGIPFAKPTMKYYTDLAGEFGEITTILGRKARFELWEPREWSEGAFALPYEQAMRAYPGKDLRRAETFKALNRELQGSAADLMKMAMYRCWHEGIFARTGVPRLTVHDELCFSDPGGVADAFREMQHVMETVIPLRVPVRAEGDIGPSWGSCKPIVA